MDSDRIFIGHREMMSIILFLSERGTTPEEPLLYSLGYRKRFVEVDVPLAGRVHEVDIHLVAEDRDRSLLVECKSHGSTVDHEQLRRYLSISTSELARSGVTIRYPDRHVISVVYFVTDGVEDDVSAAYSQSVATPHDDWGIMVLNDNHLRIAHDSQSDHQLSAALALGAPVDIENIPLDRMPFESSSPDWEVGDCVFRTIVSLFLRDFEEFTVDDVCLHAHPLYRWMPTRQSHIRKRVGRHVRMITDNALGRWISLASTRPANSEKWKFARGDPDHASTLRALSTRHRRYVEVLRSGRKRVKKTDFAGLDTEQPVLPIAVEESAYLPFDPDFPTEE